MLGILTYPVGYLYAIWKKEPGKKFRRDVRTILLLASPVLVLGFVFAMAAIFLK
jgi:hypothetical protein